MKQFAILFLPILFGPLLHANDDFPVVPDDMEVALYAQDPLVRNPCAITFDTMGRLCVGMGPQYRSPKPDTPGDSVWILIDQDQDGVADDRKQFATGFNSIQGLAWNGGDLWVANAPELTRVSDLDGDDEADEYVRVYTDLGNLEHGLHGLNFAPDGKLYMSKGNSKGHSQPPDRIAPQPFRELWGVRLPDGTPELPKPVAFKKGHYEKTYHDPRDDWGLCGGVLRCDPDGSRLEIIARGMRNPWDIAFDAGFNWLGTDNDQTQGDKFIAPFLGAHFGWGHPWSFDWLGDDHLPSAPSAGPLFEGSGAGVTWCGHPEYPAPYRDVFLVNDWLRREVYIYRPRWEGAWLRPKDETFALLAHAKRGRSMQQSSGLRFDPVDIELGPDGAMYISSWGRQYGTVIEDGKMVNEGRIYRLWPKGFQPDTVLGSHRSRPIAQWTDAQLLTDLGSHLPAWRTQAREEFIRRGDSAPLAELLAKDSLHTTLETWAIWTFAQLSPESAWFTETLNRRIQSLRIQQLTSEPRDEVRQAITDPEARIRHEAVLAMRRANNTRWIPNLLALIAGETDRIVYYSAWGALREGLDTHARKRLLSDKRPAVARAALLSLLEDDALTDDELAPLVKHADRATANLAAKRLGGKAQTLIRGVALGGRGAEQKPTAAQAMYAPLSVTSSITPVTKGSRYEEATLQRGALVYTDRAYRITQLPESLSGETFVRGANNDADHHDDTGVTLHLRYPSTVYLADDARGQELPAWARDRFEKTDPELLLETGDAKHVLYQAEFPAGKAFFGPNREDVRARKGNYVLIIQPKVLHPPPALTTVEAVLPLVATADIEHGRNLYHRANGATCYLCHRLEDRGFLYAPDLAGIGTRADADFIVRSILHPSAEITEGFASQVVTKKDGSVVSGIVIEETGRRLRLALAGGQTVEVEQADIAKREGTHTSAMPDLFKPLLRPADVAAITRYLLSGPPQTAATPLAVTDKPQKPNRSAAPDPLSGRSFGEAKAIHFQVSDNLLQISFKDQPVATYHYQHEKIRRPFFANLKTPGGLQVTRNFPPQDGDSRDHWDMHPGLSLGFAVLNGLNFWHNKDGSISHQGFKDVHVSTTSAAFTTENRYLDGGGRELATQTGVYTFVPNPDGYLLGLDLRITATEALTFGVKEEMGLALRSATPITVKFGNGSILSAGGGENEKGTWGRIDQWWDVFGSMAQRHVGVQLMSTPGNPDVWSHSRDYGVLVANPFPVDIQSNRGKTVEVPAGESLHLRFGVQVHEHAARAEYDPRSAYQRYLDSLGSAKRKR